MSGSQTRYKIELTILNKWVKQSGGCKDGALSDEYLM